MEYFNFSLSKSQFGRSNESPWSHTLTLRGHEAFSNCFVVSGVVYTILGDPGAVSRVDKMFDLKAFTTNILLTRLTAPWFSEDGFTQD